MLFFIFYRNSLFSHLNRGKYNAYIKIFTIPGLLKVAVAVDCLWFNVLGVHRTHMDGSMNEIWYRSALFTYNLYRSNFAFLLILYRYINHITSDRTLREVQSIPGSIFIWHVGCHGLTGVCVLFRSKLLQFAWYC